MILTMIRSPRIAAFALLLALQCNTIFSFHQVQPFVTLSSASSQLYSSRMSTSDLMRDMRSELAKSENEDANLIFQALRGQNLNDDDRAVAGLQMKLVDIDADLDDATKARQQLPFTYNPTILQEFFRTRPFAVATRVSQLVSVGGGFAIKIAIDTLLKRNANKESERAKALEVTRATELRDLLTSLGPFYIKIGQALSIRPDILSPRSMVELQKLCDKVPSFDSKIAFATIERELGRTIDDLFVSITPEPVAAASLGQVYQAVLRDTNETVAVKVQRPAVLETVSLDLYLARQAGLFIRKYVPDLVDRVDVVALLDEFAFRFYNELDYNLECQNGQRIAEDMKVLPMVVIPKNYPQYTSRRVHVAEWINGEKLSQSTADDVSALVNLGVITYLTQLLEGGFFHADPHPGNMMRTSDGKLAILDFGLMTEVTEDQKYGIIEAIAHLINRDYASIGQDFINLDFIPKGTDTRPIVPALTKVFDVALAGGGAKSINFQELAADLAQITFDYPFRIPPYFALVIRAISVLEGIALVGNPNFAIIDEAYPYLARRLLTDPSPRLRDALKYMVYGREGVFNAENMIDLLQALEKFSAVRDEGDGTAFKVDGVRGMKVVGGAGDFRGSQLVDLSDRENDERFSLSKPASTPLIPLASISTNGKMTAATTPTTGTTVTMTERLSSTTEHTVTATKVSGSNSYNNQGTNDRVIVTERDTVTTVSDERTVRRALTFFFSTDGEPFRSFMLEELVSVVDALSRDAVAELLGRLGGNSILPVPGFVRAFYPDLDDKDRRTVQQIRKLFQFLMGDYNIAAANGSSSNGNGERNNNNNNNSMSSDRLQKLLPIVREYGPELRNYGTLLLARLTEKGLSRGMRWSISQLQPSSRTFGSRSKERNDRSMIERSSRATATAAVKLPARTSM